MRIMSLSGSSRPESANTLLLQAIELLFPEHQVIHHYAIHELPLFRPENDSFPWPDHVIQWRKAVEQADAIIISTPEYLHNIPATIKNALEWLTSSGEMAEKRVLPITFTPHPPRGEKAMQSLIWSLTALNARIVTQLPLYQSEIRFDQNGKILNEEIQEILKEAVSLLE
jgi:NAD(P)H-dependent FMN reductase